MFRKFALTSLVAAAIATAPVAVSTASARDNFDNFLIGLTAIGILGAVVHEKNKKDRRRQVTTQPVTHHERHRHGDVWHTHPHGDRHHRGDHRVRHQHKKHVRTHKKYKKRHHNRLPNQCLRQRWTENGWVQFYSKRCLKRHGY